MALVKMFLKHRNVFRACEVLAPACLCLAAAGSGVSIAGETSHHVLDLVYSSRPSHYPCHLSYSHIASRVIGKANPCKIPCLWNPGVRVNSNLLRLLQLCAPVIELGC